MSSTPAPVGPESQVFLVDGSSFIFRAYHQSANQDGKYNMRPSDGLPTGAVRLFVTKLLQFVRDGAAGIKPTHFVITFDKSSKNSHRKELYPEYKANRPEAPEDLKPQMPLIRHAVRAFGMEPVELERYEADDLIATYAREAAARGASVLVISPDKDLMQLVGPNTRFYDFESGIPGRPGYRPERNLDHDGVLERWEGLGPNQIGDALALIGDTSDNVPGVPGIGLKTAAQLIKEYGDVESLIARASEIKQPKRRESILANADTIRLSRKLVALDEQTPLPVALDELALPTVDGQRLISFLKALELSALTKRVGQMFEIDPNAVEADPQLRAGASGQEGDTPSPARAAITSKSYGTIPSLKYLNVLVEKATASGCISIDVHANGPDLVGLSVAIAPGQAAYIPLGHQGGNDLFSDRAPGQIAEAEAIATLRPLLENAAVRKVGHDLKAGWSVFHRHGIHVSQIEDVMLLSYALDSGRNGHGLEELASRHLTHQATDVASLLGSGKNKVTFDQVPVDKASAYAAERADLILRLWHILSPRLASENVAGVYQELEVPMIPVLARMEGRGIAADRQVLSRLSGDFSQTLAGLEEEIYELAGEKFQIGSPKQIGDILFGKLQLPGAKRTPSGQWATPATILDELAEAGHVLPAKILEWRQLAKLKSTYTDSLQNHMRNGRIHTTYSLAATTTGRLSSTDPNLQNIPVRTEAGRKIRAAFVAEKGYRILSADYSQIELRLLAHMADIPQLRQAFVDGVDIHAATASAMFGVPLSEMTADLRRSAKTINFGIIYGISGFGLAQRLGIPQGEASAFIKQYFERFPGIRDYIEDTKRICREQTYVTTLFGRVCHYPQIRSQNPQERAGIERAAINAPIQGSAADIIRVAMIRMEDALKGERLSARMLLQVHDELVFEVPEDEVEATIPVVRRVMETAAEPTITLTVPLVVEAKAAANWDEAH